MAQEYDVTLKVLIENFPSDLVRLVFGDRHADIELLNRELAGTKQYIDTLAKVRIDGEEFIFHAEFFSYYESLIAERMYAYAGRIADKYPGLGVYGVVLYINEADKNRPFPNVFERRIFGDLRNFHKFDVIKVWELDAKAILRQRITGLLPLVPLMKYRTDDTEGVIRETIRQLKQKIVDVQLLGETFSGLYLFAGLKQLRALVTQLLKEENMLKMLEKSETYKEILSKGEARGEARGEAKGRREGYVGSILSVLHTRFGDFDDQDIVQRLQASEDARLGQLVAEAISVEDLDAFKKLLKVS